MSWTKSHYHDDIVANANATHADESELEWAYYKKAALQRDIAAERNPEKRVALEAELFTHTKAYAGHI